MIARKSFLELSSKRISRLKSESRRESLINEKKCVLTYLRNKCKILDLEQFYQSYMQHLRISYLILFIIIDLLVAAMHLIIFPSSFLNVGDASDIFVYLGSAFLVWGILAINFHAELIQRYPWIMCVTSSIAMTILAITDISISVYHANFHSYLLIPSYGSYLLYAIYIFVPLADHMHAFMLGMFITLLYLMSYLYLTSHEVADGLETFDDDKFISMTLFLLTINFLGMYLRIMKEINIRITFLDRRKYVEENLLLRYAREEEKRLLLSIIPAHIVDKIEHHVKSRLKQVIAQSTSNHRFAVHHRETTNERKRSWRHPELENLFIVSNDNVTILYADVINYTYLTTTLDVKTLVETLHDLFVKFDTASNEYNVVRIKFLGDCYYAVAGVSAPNEYHAKCCVDLGLRMIKDIREVSASRGLSIDMRIGVHTGSILSGVIGASKLQYDIWSKDVDIANRLEQTGIAGKVHVSEVTLQELKGEYLYEEGTQKAKDDLLLNKFGIRTFLIESPESNKEKTELLSATEKPQLEEAVSAETVENFMQNNMQQFEEFQQQANDELSQELLKMPLGMIRFKSSKSLTQDMLEEQNFRRNISSLFLYYKDWNWEMQFLKEPDDMLKYSVTMAFIVFFCIMGIQSINKVQSDNFWASNAVYIVLLIIFIVLTWFKKIWVSIFAGEVQSIPTNTYVLFLCNVSKRMQSSITARLTIYLLIILTYCSATFIQLLDCKHWLAITDIRSATHKDFREIIKSSRTCEFSFDTWGITQSLELTIIMMFLFSRIPFLVKLALGILITATYSFVIFGKYSIMYKASPTTNVGLPAEYSHLMVILTTLVIFYLMDRHTEFISKVDFNLRLQLQEKQETSEIANASLALLVNNILPSHVADIYMEKRMKNELYYEEYDNVAVMFASIQSYNIENIGLRPLNEMICEFDAVLKRFEVEGVFKVEKIKLSGWTYMAACGLNIARSQNFASRSFSGQQFNFRSSNIRKSIIESPSTSKEPVRLSRRHSIFSARQGYVVQVMAQFALELMKAINNFNMENLNWAEPDSNYERLRIGISNGPIMAGVIGSSKPLYDIWGNSVNMASRMDSTGLPGHIQVTEDTAEVLRSYNIQCNYRGMTYVKGCGEIPTYFIGIDENLDFIPNQIRSPKITIFSNKD